MIANRLAASIARSSFRAFFRQASHQVSFSARLQGLGRYFSSNADHGKGHHHKHESKGKDDHVHGKDCNHPEVDKDGKPHVHGPDCQHDHHHHHGDGHVHGPDCNHDHDHDHHHENAEDTDPTLLTITEFKNALELLQKGELMQGYERLKQVRDILENVKMHETLAYFRLLRKLSWLYAGSLSCH
jgi:hypothetical protein